MTPAVLALRAAGVAFTVHEYAHDPRSESFGLEAATELGLDPDRVYKTLMAAADGDLVVAVVPVSGRLDLKALARAVGASKAAMADVKHAERATGYVAGGISPFGQKRAHPTVVDETRRALAHGLRLRRSPGPGRGDRPGRPHRGDRGDRRGRGPQPSRS